MYKHDIHIKFLSLQFTIIPIILLKSLLFHNLHNLYTNHNLSITK